MVTGAGGYLGRRVIAALEAGRVPHISVTHSGGPFACDLADAAAVPQDGQNRAVAVRAAPQFAHTAMRSSLASGVRGNQHLL